MRNSKMIVASPMMLLPPHPSKCQVCAVEHAAEQPHNAQSLFYQVKFHMENGRDANWADAMAHCEPQMKDFWTAALAEAGVDVNSKHVSPHKERSENATAKS